MKDELWRQKATQDEVVAAIILATPLEKEPLSLMLERLKDARVSDALPIGEEEKVVRIDPARVGRPLRRRT
jgi:hypothetical protein